MCLLLQAGKASIKSSISNFQEIELSGDEHLEVHIQDFQSDERNQVKSLLYSKSSFKHDWTFLENVFGTFVFRI